MVLGCLMGTGCAASLPPTPMVDNPVQLVGDPDDLDATPGIRSIIFAQQRSSFDVTLKVCVDTEGAVDEVTVVDPTDFNESGIGGVYRGWMHDQHWKYAPNIVDGKPTRFCHLLALRYLRPPAPK